MTPRLAQAVQEGRPIRIGVFGDSFGDGVWAGLYNILRARSGLRGRISLSERSTGFTRYRSLNLLDDIRAKLDRQPVDIAIISFGANDTQGIFDGGPWQSVYERRLAADRRPSGSTAIVGVAPRARRDGLLGRPAEDARRPLRRRHPPDEPVLRGADGGARRALLSTPSRSASTRDGQYEPYLPADPRPASARWPGPMTAST